VVSSFTKLRKRVIGIPGALFQYGKGVAWLRFLTLWFLARQ